MADGWVGKGACCQDNWPEFNPWELLGRRREPSFENCLLISIEVPWKMYIGTLAHVYTYTQKHKKLLAENK